MTCPDGSLSTSSATAGCFECGGCNDDWRSCITEIGENAIQYEVYFEQLNFQRLQESVAYTLVNLISDFGGQAGLWLGVSVVTDVEALILVVELLLDKYGMYVVGFNVSVAELCNIDIDTTNINCNNITIETDGTVDLLNQVYLNGCETDNDNNNNCQGLQFNDNSRNLICSVVYDEISDSLSCYDTSSDIYYDVKTVDDLSMAMPTIGTTDDSRNSDESDESDENHESNRKSSSSSSSSSGSRSSSSSND